MWRQRMIIEFPEPWHNVREVNRQNWQAARIRERVARENGLAAERHDQERYLNAIQERNEAFNLYLRAYERA